MAYQELSSYIKAERAKGTSDEIIKSALVNAGWQPSEIHEAFANVSVSSYNNSLDNPSVNSEEIITEKDYPIEQLWVFKGPIVMTVISIVFLFIGFWVPLFAIFIPVLAIVKPLERRNFHYSLNNKFLVINQGILSKKQRNLPYGVIQNVFAKQDLFDRVFGLAALTIENASGAGGKGLFAKRGNYQQTQTILGGAESLGSIGNKVIIPGLKKENAEKLKMLILQKMKENPLKETYSGL